VAFAILPQVAPVRGGSGNATIPLRQEPAVGQEIVTSVAAVVAFWPGAVHGTLMTQGSQAPMLDGIPTLDRAHRSEGPA